MSDSNPASGKSRIDPKLLGLYQASSDPAGLATTFSSTTVIGGYVVVDFIAEPGQSEALLGELSDLGLTHGATFGRMVSGLLPIEAIGDLGSMTGYVSANASVMTSFTGSVTSQGDEALFADLARNEFSVEGSGVAVGVLSDSYDNENGEAADVSSGDLPANVIVLEDLPSSSDEFPGSDEGRAMAQIIHDVAPGADLLFHTAFLGVANFAQGILDLANAGADIIVDDVFYFSEPFFADGVIAQAVDTVTAQGVSYFSSAGNSGDFSLESAFRGVTVDPDTISLSADFTDAANSLFHDFDPGPGVDTILNFTLRDGESFQASFQWDEPYASTSDLSPGATADYDIWLINTVTGEVLDSSLANNVGADPVETLSFENETGQTLQVGFVIEKWENTGRDAEFMKTVFFEDITNADNYGEFGSSTSVGHANAAGAIGVGAAFFFDTPAFGVEPPVLEGFSSLGGTPILFTEEGDRLSLPVLRPNPTLVGPDGGNTTFFGSDAGSDGFPNFFGTSASAPHVAAVAALILDANPLLSEEQVRSILETTAIDMDNPYTAGFDSGFDAATGFGYVDALAALGLAVNTDGVDTVDRALIMGTDDGDRLNGTDAPEEIIGLGGNDILIGFGGSDILRGGDGGDVLRGGDGPDEIYGDSGDDLVRAGSGEDRVFGGDGDDLIDGGPGSDTGNDYLNGGQGDDILVGRDGDDILIGGAGLDALIGQAGNDRLNGGEGRDVLNGGPGTDTFVYESISDSLLAPANRDVIFGLAPGAGDKIDMSMIDANPATASDDAFTIVDGFSGVAGQLIYFETAMDDVWRVRADIDGDSAADFEVIVRAVTLNDGVFIL